MKRFVLTASAAALAVLALLSPALAGGTYVDDGYGARVGAHGHPGWRGSRVVRTWHSVRHREWDAAVTAGTLSVTATYGREPAYYPGTGGEGPGFGPARVRVVEYREPYIGRGLLYNVPPAPFGRSDALVTARY